MHYHYLTLEQREALEKRLREPDYGGCIECGKDIDFVRLEADPDALHCRDCARLPVKFIS